MEKLNPFAKTLPQDSDPEKLDFENYWFFVKPEEIDNYKVKLLAYDTDLYLVDCSRSFPQSSDFGFLKELITRVLRCIKNYDSNIYDSLNNIWNRVKKSEKDECDEREHIYNFFDELHSLFSLKIIFLIPEIDLLLDIIKDKEFHILYHISHKNNNIRIWTINSKEKESYFLRSNVGSQFLCTFKNKRDSKEIEEEHYFNTKNKLQSEIMEKIKLFISYAHDDETYKDELIKHLSGLKRNGVIEEWNDRYIIPGQEWDAEIKQKLNNSHIVIFLISSDFMASNYINDVEIKNTMDRHNNNEIIIIPVIIRHCDFKSLGLNKFQALPKDANPVKSWIDQDEAWVNVIEGIKSTIGNIDKFKIGIKPEQGKVSPSNIGNITQTGTNNTNIILKEGTININK
jgi:hypothetical protein